MSEPFADRVVTRGGVAGDGPVIYWCIAQRRSTHNLALQWAANLARDAGVGLIVLEALRIGYEHASPRIHRFVVDGMADNRRAFADLPVTYHPYVEPGPGDGKGLVAALAHDATAVVTDHFPHFFLPRMVAAAKVPCPLHIVDGNGLYPLAATPGPFVTALSFRRFLQRELPPRLLTWPAPSLPRLPSTDVPAAVAKRWPASYDLLDDPAAVTRLPLAHDTPMVDLPGGPDAGAARLAEFIEERLPHYLERSHPDADVASGLSPYLHFGHIGSHQAVGHVLESEGWSPDRLADTARGQRKGWWGVSEPAEAWLDQLVTWRELGFVEMHHRPDAVHLASLPDWAQATLAAHRNDPRETWTKAQIDAADTPDPLWNAAQRELLRDGRMQNHLRMLWGKRLLAHSASPEQALERMFYYNDRYALDGRDPNSVSGILWCLGRYDRGWPEREVFGKVRCMTSKSTGSKLRHARYLARYGD